MNVSTFKFKKVVHSSASDCLIPSMNENPGLLEEKLCDKNKSNVVLCPSATGKIYNHHLVCTLELGK